MGRFGGKFRRQVWLLLAVAVLDGALLGGFAGMADAAGHGITNAANSGTIQTTNSNHIKDLRKSEKVVALTFDDGPNADYTETLLKGLEERGVKATFFLVGSEVEKHPEIVRKIQDGGHLIGTHSYDHVNLYELSDNAAMEQVEKTNAAICRITGEYPQYIRPPFGCWNESLDDETSMVKVFWDVDPKDWATNSAELVAKRVVSKVEESDIILLHDASESSVKAAFMIIEELKKAGYTFVTVDEMLLD